MNRMTVLCLVWLGLSSGTATAQTTAAQETTQPGGTLETAGRTAEGITEGLGLRSGAAGTNVTEEFVGGGRDDGEGFVGGTRQGQRSPLRRFFEALSGSDSVTGRPQKSSANTPRRQVAVCLKPGFPTPSPDEAALLAGTPLQTLFRNHPDLKSVLAVQDGAGRVKLTGTVSGRNTRRLAENLARLTPGVRHIDNDLVITADSEQPDRHTKTNAK